ncbi:hypothetical protein SAMN04487786_2014 [Paenisporosarcina quisquiliarum]|nr:hypothetical protein SAMN04487786_2014 [Paenisporosarcina quisquiliarum]
MQGSDFYLVKSISLLLVSFKNTNVYLISQDVIRFLKAIPLIGVAGGDSSGNSAR